MKTEYEQRQFEAIYNKFLNQRGVYTKVTDDNGKLFGYLLRCELAVENAPKDTVFVGFGFVASAPKNVVFNKTVGMNSCMVSGIRHIQKLMESKQIESLKEYCGRPLDSIFTFEPAKSTCGYVDNTKNVIYISNTPTEEYIEGTEEYISNIFNYNKFYEYMISFEKKARKYYKEKRIIPVWCIANNTFIIEDIY